jgi:hypothetical protein
MLVLRKGYGPLSAGTRVDIVEVIDKEYVRVDAGMFEMDIPVDYLVERRPRTRTLNTPSVTGKRRRAQRRAVDPIVQAKREEYEKRT